MRVLLISHGAGPYGAERVLLELARRLAERDHHIVLDFPHPGPSAEEAANLRGVDLRIGARGRLPRNPLEAVAYFGRSPADILAVRRLVRDVAPDATWVNSIFNPWAALGAQLAGSPTVWHLHERNLRGVAGWLMTAFIRLFADRAVGVSEYVAESFHRAGWLHERVRVVHNPLVGEWEQRDEPTALPFTVGCIGQLEPRKRASDLARAIALLPAHVQGLFVGDGKDRKGLEVVIREVGVEDRIELLGYRIDVPTQLTRVHCLAIPSLDEPFGLVALESMASGVPVIAARSGALPEVLGEAALYHEPEDPVDLARQIERLRRRPELRLELRRKGLERVARFRPEAWVASVEFLLREVTEAGASPGPERPTP